MNPLDEMEARKLAEDQTPLFGLMHAVLLTAVKDMRGRPGKSRDEAYKWLTDRQSHHVFSFVPLCLALGYDPSFLRRKILSLDGKKKLPYIRPNERGEETQGKKIAHQGPRQALVARRSGSRRRSMSILSPPRE